MDRNNEGPLQESEREELEALVELSERLPLVRGGAIILAGRVGGKPGLGGCLPPTRFFP